MRIQFLEIQIHNFMSFTDATINLNVPGYILVSGENNNKEDNSKSNGSGKSSIFEAVLWCITGETQRGISGKDVLKRNEKEGYCKLLFKVDNDEYEITRSISKSQNLQIVKNGEDISGKGIRASESILKDNLPELSMSLLSNIVIFGQGLPNRFTGNSPSGRKEVLEKLFKADFMIEDIKSRISSRLSYLKEEQRTLEDSILSLRSKCDILRESIASDTKELSSLEDPKNLKNQAEKYKIDLQKLEITFRDISESNKNSQKINNDINKQISILNDKKRDVINDDYLIEDIEKLKEKGSNLKNDIALLDKEIEKKDNITDTCPTCGQKLIGVEKPDTSQDKEKSKSMKIELDKLREEFKLLQNKRNEYINSQVSELDNKYTKLQKGFVSIEDTSNLETQISSIKNQITSIENELTIFEKKKIDLQTNISKNENTIRKLEEEVNKLLIDKLKLDSRIDTDNKINTIIKRDFRGYLLANIISLLNTTCKEYSIEVFNHDKLDIKQEGNNINILFNGKNYLMLSSGEKQKVDVILQLGIKKVLERYVNITSNILVLDEITDALDTESAENILNMITNKINIPSIFMVSHHSDFQIPVDSNIIVKKNSKGSTAIQL